MFAIKLTWIDFSVLVFVVVIKVLWNQIVERSRQCQAWLRRQRIGALFRIIWLRECKHLKRECKHLKPKAMKAKAKTFPLYYVIAIKSAHSSPVILISWMMDINLFLLPFSIYTIASVKLSCNLLVGCDVDDTSKIKWICQPQSNQMAKSNWKHICYSRWTFGLAMPLQWWHDIQHKIVLLSSASSKMVMLS